MTIVCRADLSMRAGRGIRRAWGVLPPRYLEDPARHYPTVSWTHGFGGTLAGCRIMGAHLYERMAAGKMPPMIWVMLDEPRRGGRATMKTQE
jgi:hypothetical protein